MSLTARDRKILIILGVLVLPIAYWFLLLSPKRAQEGKLQSQLTQARSAEQSAAQRVASLNQAKRSFASDYTTIIRLGKSIPSTLDMSSLLFQLNAAAGGNGIIFSSVTSGARSSAPGTASSPSSTTGAPTASPPAASGTSSTTPASTTSSVPGLDSVPITFEFDGSFFDLASFFHQVKRFVQVANGQVQVSGRLITIDNLEFKTPNTSGSGGGASASELQATVTGTVYLAPKSQGLTAGATPTGPTPTGPAQTPASTPASSASPAAAVIAR
jgi:Tfp pilus assembly protein PilO